MPGDLLVEVDQEPIVDRDHFASLFALWKPDQTVQLKVIHTEGDSPGERIIEVKLLSYAALQLRQKRRER